MKSFFRKYITSRPLWVNILVALLLMLLIGALFFKSLNWITQHGVARTVPSITGKNINAVTEMLEGKGFAVVIQDSVFYDSLPPSVIIKQFPEADAVVKVNRTIYVTINRVVAPDMDMPNLVGYSFRNAEMVLKNLGLRLGDTSSRPDFAKNSVLEQLYRGTPISPGTKIKIGSSVSLVLGTGLGNFDMAVPKLLGLTYTEAKILMDEQGLIVGAVLTDPMVKDTANAFVYWQSPEPKDETGRLFRIRPGQMIDIRLSLDPPVTDTLQKANPPGPENDN